MQMRTLLAVLAVLALSPSGDAYQMYQSRIPNGRNVAYGGEAWPGVGHESRYGAGTRNSFGLDFASAGRKWTLELCQKDSDGDGKTNGEELGDPDCTWVEGQPIASDCVTHPGKANTAVDFAADGCGGTETAPCGHNVDGSSRADGNGKCLPCAAGSFAPTDADDCAVQIMCGKQIDGTSRLTGATPYAMGTCAGCHSGTQAPDLQSDCVAMAVPDTDPMDDSDSGSNTGPRMSMFNPGEVQKSFDFRVNAYELPKSVTTYTDFVFNLPEDMTAGDGVHIVYGEAIVDQPDHLHHFVVTGCTEQFPEQDLGMPVLEEAQTQRVARACQTPLGGFSGWAPGATLWDQPPDIGVPVGGVTKIVALHINAHYTDADKVEGKIISNDGIRIHYTPTFRQNVLYGLDLISIGSSDVVSLPQGQPRLFLTRTCRVEKTHKDRPIHVVGAFHHAHLLGREMYITLTKADGTIIDLNSVPEWDFDRQSVVPLNITIEKGDYLQSACVWDTTEVKNSNSDPHDGPVKLGLSTYDEMCFNSLYVKLSINEASHHDTLDPFQCDEDGRIWMGALDDDDDIMQNPQQVWEQHSSERALKEGTLFEVHGGEPYPLGTMKLMCDPCHADEANTMPMGAHCWASQEAFQQGNTEDIVLAARPPDVVCGEGQYKQVYFCSDAFDNFFKDVALDSGDCEHYRSTCCNKPKCGTGTSWSIERGLCIPDYAAIVGACRSGHEELSFVCLNQGVACADTTPRCDRCHTSEADHTPMGANCWASHAAFERGSTADIARGGESPNVICGEGQYKQVYFCSDAFDNFFKDVARDSGDCEHYRSACC
jgi:dopamine beta-monooxygenase